MSTEAFRTAAQTLIQSWMTTNHSTIKVVLENGPAPDQDAVGSPWLDVSIKWQQASNVTTGVRARGRQHGVLVTNVFTREGEGTATSDQLIDGLVELLRNSKVGGGTLQFPARDNSPALLGWVRAGLKTPFFVDSA